jgi:hypothetical protein
MIIIISEDNVFPEFLFEGNDVDKLNKKRQISVKMICYGHVLYFKPTEGVDEIAKNIIDTKRYVMSLIKKEQ